MFTVKTVALKIVAEDTRPHPGESAGLIIHKTIMNINPNLNLIIEEGKVRISPKKMNKRND